MNSKLHKNKIETGEEMAILKSKKSLHGVTVPHRKHTENSQSVLMNKADQIRIPMQQHMGAPCVPLVKAGDRVLLGQKIGDSGEFFSVPIHASCSGTVTGIEDYQTINGMKTKLVVIENDHQYEVSPEVEKPNIRGREDFLKAVRESGLVGLGGAGFPVHV